MNDLYQVVPWYNTDEWNEVYSGIFSEEATYDTKENALKTLFIWKSRCPSLPSAIESTLSLIEVHVKDKVNDCAMVDNQLLRLSYSSAIMRFVNHMFDADAAKNNSLYQVAEKRGVPDWIVDLRHDTAHSSNLPALELLRDATSICLQWLKDNYWDIHSRVLKNCTVSKIEINTVSEEQLKTFINFCISLSFCSHPKCHTKNLANMPAKMQQSLVSDAQELFCGKIDLSNLKKVSVNNLMNYIQPYSKNFFRKVNKDQLFEMLLNNESMFLSQEIYDVMSMKNKSQGLDRQYIKCFEFLLKLLHTHDLLQDFILQLIKITETKDQKNQCQLAAKWISEILKALQRSQSFMKAVKEKGLPDIHTRKNKELISLFHHWFPNEKSTHPLLLDLCKPIPSSFTDINFIRSIISTYNPYLNYFIYDLLQLVKPKLPPFTLKQICKLAELIASPEKFPAESSKIYTIDDLNKSNKQCESEVVLETKANLPHEIEVELNSVWGIWKKAPKSHAWASCPIGLLPWQQDQESAMEID